jgi:hypothetical protein
VDISRFCFAIVNKTAPTNKVRQSEADLAQNTLACGRMPDGGKKTIVAPAETATSSSGIGAVGYAQRTMTRQMIVKNTIGG